jgi:sterol desaturase/sphingolipid hydroxylase (fatty acid hydroxylase superfamily)
MLSYEKILLYYAIPYFTISMVIELIYARTKGDNIRLVDMVASLSSGMTNILKGTIGLSVTIISYEFMLQHFQLFHWEGTALWMYAVAFVYIDFTGYWVHRIEHTVNFFWNYHIIHHSSEEFNLACALRQSISDFIAVFTVFSLPMALLGIPLVVVAIVGPVHLFMQFWYHTRYIDRIGILEKVIVTPSHHRVHHAMNDQYLDKNYGQIFIFWDKLFGTYQDELKEVEPVYGVKRPVKTWNPFLINFQHFFVLLSDAWHTRNYADKMRVWFMPTGWRPADVAERTPIPYVADMSAFKKHDPAYSMPMQLWSLLQMLGTLLSLCFLFYRIGDINSQEKLAYGLFLMFTIFAYTAVMDKKTYGVVAMVVQAAIAIGLIVSSGDWFGLRVMTAAGPSLLAAYFALSAAAAIYFQFSEFSAEQEQPNMGSAV